MKFSYLIVISLVTASLATPAWARHEPTPPPSGIVVHLFGPGSITSGIMPSFTTAPSGANPAARGPANPASGATTGNPLSPAQAADQPAPYQEPSMHDVLHQMFVVGDPSKPSSAKLATGRKNDHP